MSEPKARFKTKVRRALGPFGYDALAKTDAYAKIRDPGWSWDPRAVASRSALLAMKDRYKGQTGFIIGTGPSIRQQDLSPLVGQFSIGLNRLYLAFDQMKFTPDYMICVNDVLVSQNVQDFSSLPMPLVSSWACRKSLRKTKSAIFLRTVAGTGFYDDITHSVPVGSTVTYVAIQLLHWMGFDRVVLVGIDHNYDLCPHEEEAGSHKTVQRVVADTNHFHEDYVQKGASWQIPDLVSSENAYMTARTRFECGGRQIFDATQGGHLKVFEKVSLSDMVTPK